MHKVPRGDVSHCMSGPAFYLSVAYTSGEYTITSARIIKYQEYQFAKIVLLRRVDGSEEFCRITECKLVSIEDALDLRMMLPES
jgi:hypothetical protein